MQTREELIALCKSFGNVYEDYPFHDSNWTVMRHRVGKKAFAFIYRHGTYLWVNFKAEPDAGRLWREMYPSVVEAYHMNKEHWCSIILDGGLPHTEVVRLLKESYELTETAADRRKEAIKHGCYRTKH